MSATRVTFPAGTTHGQGVVSRVHADGDAVVVVVDATPFHPVDHTWPDQPGDSGRLRFGEDSVTVIEAVMAAVSDDGAFAVGADIPVKRGVEGWTWLVGHRLDVTAAPAWLTEGVSVELEVDEGRRHALSRGHSACHLASLALDLAVADLWRKDAVADALGNPDFEGRANQSSRIHDDGAVDEYRLGKSLRKVGFDTEAFAATLAERETRINEQLALWTAAGSASTIETDGPTIVDRRRWKCSLPEGDAVMLCGGTHVSSLAEFDSITVSLAQPDPQTLVMVTTAVAG